MITRFSFIAVFFAGGISGWLGKTWYESVRPELPDAYQNAASRDNIVSPNSTQSIATSTSDRGAAPKEIFGTSPLQEIQITDERSSSNSGTAATGTAVSRLEVFKRLLSERAYNDAMNLYQEQAQLNSQSAGQYKRVLLDQLRLLSDTSNNSDFSELIENYLSIYYDDVDVLLILADFNQANGRYFEVVDVYLLAKTYAYSNADQKSTVTGFNDFLDEIDNLYTNQKNWVSLINLYSHIETSGLMTSPYKFRQALAHLRSGDEYFAIEQFNLLLNDSLVGESAAIALNNLTGISETPAATSSSVWEDSQSIELQKLGNQYLVNLTGARQTSVKLLIDTGASMTTLSRLSFENINADGDAVEQERRLFRTASGVIMGTVYVIPRLGLGPYTLNDTQIAVLDDFGGEREIDGLLGMNILGQFRFQIDQDEGRLLLSRE